MTKNRSSIFTFLICFLFGLTLNSQQKNTSQFQKNYEELGLPYIQNYTPQEYKSDSQNWAIVQSKEGLIYIGNSSGILEYDGVSWRLIQLPNKGVVQSLAISKKNRIYVGGYNDLGYLEPDSIGQLSFISLKKQLDKVDQDFQEVWRTAIIEDVICFQSKNKLMLWNGEKFRIFKPESTFLLSKVVNNKLYLVESKGVLKRLKNDALEVVLEISNPENTRVKDIVPYEDGQMLVLTEKSGLRVLKEGQLLPFPSPVNKYLSENIGFQIIKLSNGWYSIATIRGGIAIIDVDGEVIKLLGKAEGIADEAVLFQFEDQQEGLWLATNNGISRVELLSPYTVFDDRLGIEGYVNRIYRHDGDLYVANLKGILRLEYDKPGMKSVFNPVERMGAQGFYFIALGDTLVAASRNGTDMIKDNKVIKRFDYRSSSLLRSKIDPNRIYIGLRDGLASIKYSNGEWVDGGVIDGVKDDIREIVEDKNGSLWLESYIDGVWKVDFERKDPQELLNPKVRHFTAHKELPEGVLFLHQIRGQTLFAIDAQIYSYNRPMDSIIPDSSFRKLFNLSGKISPKSEDEQGNIWMFTQIDDQEGRRQVIKAAKQVPNTYKLEKIFDERLPDGLRASLLPEDNDVVWYGGSPGIVRQDLTIPKNYEMDFNSHIRRVMIAGDSVLFGGSEFSGEMALPFRQNKYRFEFAATYFEDEPRNIFQSYLEGFDEDWSEWTSETKRDYTNIPEGAYTFRVRAKNIYNHISNEDDYSFAILPPWHRSWWAYLGYALAGIFGIWLISQWQSKQLRKKNIKLEALVDERTKEIRHKNKLLGHQTERLKEMDTMKTRLFANISHEFRTPLTLIKGPIEKLEETQKNKISTANIKMIRRNANRLLNLVNQLLDLSKLDSGKLKLNAAEGDVFKCLRAAASAFGSHAASRKMDYQIKIPTDLLWVEFDRDKLEKITYNLLSNALKFTPDEGMVIIEAEFRSGRLRLKVSDTGNGISADKLPHIFDRFFQVDDSYTKEKAGSGIGLALTKELVELMGGTIFVESEFGRGTLFRVVLPLEEIQSGSIKEDEEIPQTVIGDALHEPMLRTQREKEIKILIIEDNNDMRHFIREQLEQEYAILEAVNGKQGFAQAKKIIPDLIITDLMMPQMDGITLCKKLKTDLITSHIPIIMLTAKAGIENKIEGLETGADDYLTKPFNAKELQIRTKNLIKQRQRLRELFSRNISLDPKEITVTSLDEEFLNKLLSLFEEKYTDSAFGVPQMQKELGMGKTTLHSKLKALTNHPPGELLRNFRLRRAAQLLAQNNENVSQIAYDVGFNSLSYFTRCFKGLFMMSPTEFKEKNT